MPAIAPEASGPRRIKDIGPYYVEKDGKYWSHTGAWYASINKGTYFSTRRRAETYARVLKGRVVG